MLTPGWTKRFPASGSMSPAAILSKVDLPDPLRPTSAMRSRGADGQFRALKQRLAAKGQTNVSQLQNRGHMKGSNGNARSTRLEASGTKRKLDFRASAVLEISTCVDRQMGGQRLRRKAKMLDTAVTAALAALAAHRSEILARGVAEDFAADPARFSSMHVVVDDLLFDYSKQRVDPRHARPSRGARQSRRCRGQARGDVSRRPGQSHGAARRAAHGAAQFLRRARHGRGP